MNRLFLNNILINDLQFCPHHPEAKLKKYRINCTCRKPKSGMIKNILKKWPIISNKSLFIGDRIVDKIAAESCNLKFLNIRDISY